MSRSADSVRAPPRYRPLVRTGTEIECCADGVHRAATARLRIVAGSYRHYARYEIMAADPEAQRWLGWSPSLVADLRAGRYAHLADSPERMLTPYAQFLSFAGLDHTGTVIAGVTVDRAGPRPDVGVVVARHCRGQGYGTELLVAATAYAHRHFGMPRLTAGCEDTNVASRTMLARAGFAPMPGPRMHTLQDGRVIPALWWEKTAEPVPPACRFLSLGARSQGARSQGARPPRRRWWRR
jgi:RimJ/RimL family protein N-acetyltransferase